MPEFIYTMQRLTKVHPPDRTVVEDVTLAFLPGAKIGVLGPNGAGKSTLLRIMAGVDTEFRGDARLADGATVGLLEQEPQLDSSKDVRGNVEDGVAELRDMVNRFNELAANYSDETADEGARLQDEMDRKAQVFRTDESLSDVLGTIEELRERYRNVHVDDIGLIHAKRVPFQPVGHGVRRYAGQEHNRREGAPGEFHASQDAFHKEIVAGTN